MPTQREHANSTQKFLLTQHTHVIILDILLMFCCLMLVSYWKKPVISCHSVFSELIVFILSLVESEPVSLTSLCFGLSAKLHGGDSQNSTFVDRLSFSVPVSPLSLWRLFCRFAKSSWACFQVTEKNELCSSKHAYSWPFVSFDLGIRRLHECPYCHVMCTQCVNYWKWRGPGFIWERLQCWHAEEVG